MGTARETLKQIKQNRISRRQTRFEAIIIIILAAFAIGGIWAYAVSKKVKKEGIETDAVVSRVELHEWGDRMKIKYLPDRQDYPVLVKIL